MKIMIIGLDKICVLFLLICWTELENLGHAKNLCLKGPIFLIIRLKLWIPFTDPKQSWRFLPFSALVIQVFISILQKEIFRSPSLILEKPIFEKLISDHKKDMEEFLNLENTRLFTCDQRIELASSIITDRFISLSMVSKDGRYYNHEMISFEKSALTWGRELFDYYKDLSEEIFQI